MIGKWNILCKKNKHLEKIHKKNTLILVLDFLHGIFFFFCKILLVYIITFSITYSMIFQRI